MAPRRDLRLENLDILGQRSGGLRGSENPNELQISWEFVETSIYNPIWAFDQPQHGESGEKCVALDLLSERSVGWRMFNCSELLPVLCETFACLESEFRCNDNSRCVPKSAVMDGVIDCGDGSDEKNKAAIAMRSSNLVMSNYGCHDITMTSPKGRIVSPNYPQNYDERTFCKWEIIAPHGQVVTLNVSIFQTELASRHHVNTFSVLQQGEENASNEMVPDSVGVEMVKFKRISDAALVIHVAN
ncbi:Low-density lipoprotein receptor domain class A [Necator americanus]|uniref:Low-density lipoprotein receptor domain class A n=1 Tax=Necator americanus TaxID=51031 RepID=W2T0T8_NECAM|nr:Low-density lipoprotein receptor domain class A [Necator americanus]ETN75620.1 Low-density lipoprotein receptor domain class A [Necator americanus]